jgi:hypothetical protein
MAECFIGWYRNNGLKTVRVLTVVFVLATASACFGQGLILFDNIGGGVNAPITNAAGNLISQGSSYVADLFYSTNLNTLFDALPAAGYDQPFLGSGYFMGGQKTLIGIYGTILAQVRVWDTKYGSTYYETRDHGGEFGFSNFITIIPALGPFPPTSLVGLQGFQLQRLPRVTSTVTSTNTIVFSWPTEQTTYAVQQNLGFSPTNWVTLPNTPVTVGQNQQVILPVPKHSRLFYRLVSQ